MEIYKNIDDVKYWKNKYNPQKIEDLDINPDIVQKIKKWLNDFDKNKKKYFESLLKKNKILVRKGPGVKGYENYLRITLGSKDQMKKILSLLKKAIA